MRRLLLALALGLSVAACGGSPSTPSRLVSTAPPLPPASVPFVVLTGQVNATVTGQPVSGVTLDLEGRVITTDANGTFRYDLTPGIVPTPLLKLTGPTTVERSLFLSLAGSRQVTLDVIALSGGFDAQYYRRLVRDDYDFPGQLRSLRRWNQAPRLYVRTVDEDGQPVEAATLEPIVSALQDDPGAWTGGRFGLAGIERGTETREGVSGWITVKWPTASDTGICGRAQVAVNGGWIELYYLNRLCACGSSRISPKTAKHELGHAMGFYHSGDREDVMWGTTSCDSRGLSTRERFHAAVAYSRAVGNTDPDNDPTTLPLRYEPPVVVVN